jgi:O-antigen/teichoic acid export membrane protein
MRLSRSVVSNMLMLYAGKTSSLLVAFLFLPLYNHRLGPEQFGFVAVILSLQALLVMMDLGVSTLVGREIAIESETGDFYRKLIRTAELTLSMFYSAVLCGALTAVNFGFFIRFGWLLVFEVILLFWLLVLQNLYYSALIANRNYIAGSTVQIVGVIARACGTAYVLSFHSATLQAFVFTQLVFAAIHWWISRIICMKKISGSKSSSTADRWPTFPDAIKLTRAGRALLLFSAAGAAVTQLDKPIISMFVSAASVAPYYLASLLCMTPVSILASPISQYFQPALLRGAESGFNKTAQQLTGRFVFSLFIATAIPTLVLWWFRAPIIDMWVGGRESNEVLSGYVGILLPGLAVGALGFIPYSLLVMAKDFRFQAGLSGSMTIVTLSLVTYAAMKQNVEAICIIYSAYHATSTVASWLRAMTLPQTKRYAQYSGLLALTLVVLFTSVVGIVSFVIF